ncbi:hypothetical protein, partial [Streptococcus pneumoniae]|uniref:hypothetical protein n=1 Tax=Streptococcus pneumoniae TaxID=1313 RepID=UPI001C717F8A
SKIARERALLDVSKANTFITHSYLFVCLLLYYKSWHMGIFFAPRQECPHLTKNNLKKCSLFLFFSEYKSEQEKRRKVQ